MASLPKYVCFFSEKRQICLRYKNDNTETGSLLQFEGNNGLKDACYQFKIVESKDGDGLVHIKCRYNNLYFVRWSRSHYWISASANEPNEDITSWACTLFKPIELGDYRFHGKKIRLLHVQSERYVRHPSSSVSAPYVSCLLADSKEPDNDIDSSDILIAFPLMFLFKHPKRVAFKGDNDLYLGAQLFDGRPGLQFSFKDAKDPKVAHQVITFPDGTISVKSEYYGRFWRVERDNFIVVDADGPNPDNVNNTDTGTFRVKWTDFSNFGLLSMNPTSFLKRMNAADMGWMDSIAAATQNIDTSASRMGIVDLDKYGRPATLQKPTDFPTNHFLNGDH